MCAKQSDTESEGNDSVLSRLTTKTFDVNDPSFERPFTDGTLKFRRTLIVVSGVALVAALGNLFPTGIPSLGIHVASDDRLLIDWVTIVSIVYLLAQFVVNAYVDLVKWQCAVISFVLIQKDIRSAVEGLERRDIKGMDQFLKDAFGRQPRMYRQLFRVLRNTDKSTMIQLSFDIAVPVAMAIGALVALLMDVTDAI